MRFCSFSLSSCSSKMISAMVLATNSLFLINVGSAKRRLSVVLVATRNLSPE